MKKSLNQVQYLIFCVLSMSLILTTNTARARSGCCSHHGGVCGCGCCDGSPLSVKCAPYYPCTYDSSNYNLNNNLPAKKFIPIQTTTTTMQLLSPTNMPVSTSSPSTGWVNFVGGVGAAAITAILISKYEKQKHP